MYSRLLRATAISLAACFAPPAHLNAQTATDGDQAMVLVVYSVADLFLSTPDHPYGQDELLTAVANTDHGGMGGMGGMIGWAGGGMAGQDGVPGEEEDPQHKAAERATLPQDMSGLIETMYATVDPSSWNLVGGTASCVGFGSNLVVSQTRENQDAIALLLDAIKSGGGTANTVVIEAFWLLLDSEQLDAILDPAATARIAVNPAALQEVLGQAASFRGQIACFSGQTVHIAAGSRRSVVTGASPVVASTAAYSPVMAIANVGIVLELTPSLIPTNQSAVLDLKSTVTGWEEPGPPVRIGGHYPAERKVANMPQGVPGAISETPAGVASIEVDRVNMPTQQLATTLRIPLGKPMLVGGLTLDPTEGGSDGERKQLYLVIQANIADSE